MTERTVQRLHEEKTLQREKFSGTMERKYDREKGTVSSWRENIPERIVWWRHEEKT